MSTRTNSTILSLGVTAAREAYPGTEFSTGGLTYRVISRGSGYDALEAKNSDKEITQCFRENLYRIVEKTNKIGMELILLGELYTTGIQEVEFPEIEEIDIRDDFAAEEVVQSGGDCVGIRNLRKIGDRCLNILKEKIRELHQLDESVTFEVIDTCID